VQNGNKQEDANEVITAQNFIDLAANISLDMVSASNRMFVI